MRKLVLLIGIFITICAITEANAQEVFIYTEGQDLDQQGHVVNLDPEYVVLRWISIW